MKSIFFLFSILFLSCNSQIIEEEEITNNLTRGVCLTIPNAEIDRFVNFIENDLTPRGVNLLVVRMNYSYQWESHPELAGVFSKQNALKLKNVCAENGIELVPLINCLGHQSWGTNYGTLLNAYPHFEENPGDKINADDFYCRSYCPLHPEIHPVLFDLFDEIIDVLEPKYFHVGMDEVFILGEDSCKNGCAGQNKATLFADEVNRLHNYLDSKNVKTWMWGDRLIDGESTGLGMWQASINETHPAIDLISKEITICDWHYKTITKTAGMFANKGFDVISCPHQVPNVAMAQLADMKEAQQSTDLVFKNHMKGILHTAWVNTSELMDTFEGKEVSEKVKGVYDTFIQLSDSWKN
ncbi:MAG: family 20 glycosylhydrolase [Bacteroidetes bacterium]|nr:family 20 glycosylhydrolase [Bacteroidota bacterium]